MRRVFSVFAAAAALAVLSGCYISLHPVVSPDIQVFEPSLVGTWEERDGINKDVWVFTRGPRAEHGSYVVEIVEPHAPVSGDPAPPLTARFKGRLGKIGDLLVLDLEADESSLGRLKDHAMLMMGLVPGHLVFRVRLADNGLSLATVDAAWLDRAIAAKTIRIAHEHLGDGPNPHEGGRVDAHAEADRGRVLLTAPTPDLQALIREHGKAGLFNDKDGGEFVRKR